MLFSEDSERVEIITAALSVAMEMRYNERKQLAQMIANEVVKRFK